MALTSGLVLLDKPSEMTSFDCIREIKKALNRRDVGHGGTLDKFATGLLPVLVGDGLKLVRFFLESYPELSTYWKTYQGVFVFGTRTLTGDPEGEIIESRPLKAPLDTVHVQEAMQTFIGQTYEQRPPVYSAKKLQGFRASDLARAGETPELAAVPVHIKRFNCLSVDQENIRFEVECSKGTYVRVLAEDLAAKLGEVAYTKELRRTHVGCFSVEQAISLSALCESPKDQAVLSMTEATRFLPRLEILENEIQDLRVGKTTNVLTRLANSGGKPGAYCAVSATGIPLALLQLHEGRRTEFLRALQF